MARSGLVTAIAAVALATTACTLPEAPEREQRTNADAARGKPFPSQAPKQPGVPTLDIVAKAQGTEWEKEEYDAKPGVTNISFTSPEGSNHNLYLVGPGAPYPLKWGAHAGAPADHLTYAVELQKGTYTFYCAVPGHRAGGMEGKITVA